MLTSLAWLNRLLSPSDLTADEAERLFIRAGFPIESREELPGGDVRLDVEITSNRGDCMSHAGLAREIAAASGRRLTLPVVPFDVLEGLPPGSKGASASRATDATSVENVVPDVCPRFTARVIRGVKVCPSPRWLAQALESVGQRPINNVVDASNYVLFELGNPTHAFDLNRLAGKRIVVRYARANEPFTALDGKKHTLRPDELVVADAERTQSLAGVIGGLDTGVTERTTDVLIEAATWDPATIRRAARRLRIATDAGKRFERFVDARTLDFAAARVAAIILETGGGELLSGSIGAGAPLPTSRTVTLRAGRCRDLLGIRIEAMEMSDRLSAIGVENVVDPDEDTLRCVIPAHRSRDLTREVDLIEEIARVKGYDSIPVHERMSVSITPPQASERAARELGGLLAGLGFFETVTFSFVARDEAELFMPAGRRAVTVDEERRKDTPCLRPSVAPSLLHCRRVNQDAGVKPDGGVRLFEVGPWFQQADNDLRETVEGRALALLMDAPDRQLALRSLRGVVETAARAMGGHHTRVEVAPRPARGTGIADDASGELLIEGKPIGWIGLASPRAQSRYGLDEPVALAEVDVNALIALFPPRAIVEPLPQFPGIDRDLSIVVAEEVAWAQIEDLARGLNLARLTDVAFVGTYRGKQAGAGRKSVTVRLRFQSPDRTLRHEEVDPEVNRLIDALRSGLAAELRS